LISCGLLPSSTEPESERKRNRSQQVRQTDVAVHLGANTICYSVDGAPQEASGDAKARGNPVRAGSGLSQLAIPSTTPGTDG
jgi:hypothetical protein